MKKYYYTYNEFTKDISFLADKIKQYSPECIIAIARGGMTIAHFLGEKLNMRDVYTINAIHYNDTEKLNEVKIFNFPDLSDIKQAVIVDDISDSGDTLEAVLNILKNNYPNLKIKIATLFYKEDTKIMPDIYIKKADEWIVFFWDREGQILNKEQK